MNQIDDLLEAAKSALKHLESYTDGMYTVKRSKVTTNRQECKDALRAAIGNGGRTT